MRDGRGISCILDAPPRRIVSLVPSTTETLHVLGLGSSVVGVTRFCVRPQPWVSTVSKIGGTKDPDRQKIEALRPDLIIANCEENTREAFAELSDLCPIWAAFPKDVDGAQADLAAMGELLGVQAQAAACNAQISAARARCRLARKSQGPFRYAWLIWRNPWMTANDDTFISSMMAQIGGQNVFGDRPDRFPEFDPSELAALDVDVVLLSSEPFPFKARHRAELAALTSLSPDRFRFVDGQYGTWHGVRMAEALAAFSEYRTTQWPQDLRRSP